MLVAIDTSQVFHFLSIAAVFSLVAIAKIFNTARKPPRQLNFLSDEQRSLSGVWVGHMSEEEIFLEVSSLGEIVEGSLVRGSRVYSIRNGTLQPPVVRFDLVERDGTGILFTGRITPDGFSIRGHWSSAEPPEPASHGLTTFPWDLTRLRIASKFESRRVSNPASSTDSIAPGVSPSGSVLAPYLIYSALSGLVNSCPALVASHPADVDCGAPPAERKSNLAPALAVLPSVDDSVERATCSQCGSDWNEDFAFCLRCGCTQR